MELAKLHTELKRRKVALEMDGPRLIAIDPYERLSPALGAAIREHRDTLVSELEPVSAGVRGLQEAVEDARAGTDREEAMEDVDAAYQRGEITQEEVEELAQMAWDRSRQIPATVKEMPLVDFASSGLVRKVESKALGETVVWAADNAEVDPECDLTVYRAAELRLMADRSPEQMRAIHLAKGALDGELIDPPPQETIICAEDLIQRDEGDADTCPTCSKMAW